MISFVIYGDLPSMKNSKQLVMLKGRLTPIKSKDALAWERSALLQIPAHAKQMLEGELAIHVDVYYPNEKRDLDCELLYDVLSAQYVKKDTTRIINRKGVYLNDRQLRSKHAEHYIDALHPRVEITIKHRNQTQLFTQSKI